MPGRALARRAAEAVLYRDLKTAFRRVVWIGDGPPDPDRPVVWAANHHAFHDGHFLWWLAVRTLKRPSVLWMAEWDRFPLFGPVGTLPFPADDPRRRAATLRRTARHLQSDPRATLLLFPEGHLGPPDLGLQDLDEAVLKRMHRVLGEPAWQPIAIRVTWWGEDKPTALLTAGPLLDTPDGLQGHLKGAMDALAAVDPGVLDAGGATVLLDGARSPEERWSFRFLAPLMERWT